MMFIIHPPLSKVFAIISRRRGGHNAPIAADAGESGRFSTKRRGLFSLTESKTKHIIQSNLFALHYILQKECEINSTN
jgi:hypothetical protein